VERNVEAAGETRGQQLRGNAVLEGNPDEAGAGIEDEETVNIRPADDDGCWLG
jgi:hypothetical protein